jgi:hypothetical protein
MSSSSPKQAAPCGLAALEPPSKKAKVNNGGLASFGFGADTAPTKSTFKTNTKPAKLDSPAREPSVGSLPPPSDGFFPPLKSGELMHSTKQESASKRAWVRHMPNKGRDMARAYCSTDGSSSGWHAAVFVGAGSSEARVRATWKDHLGSRNVGAEAFGFQLGVSTLSEDCTDCVFLADFLNALAWDCGGATYKHPAIVDAYDGKGGVKAIRRALGHTRSNSTWDHCHHPGHKTDDSWFTLLNQVADNMASSQVEADIMVPIDALKELAVQGKDAVDKCRLVIEKYATGASTEIVPTN